MTRLAVVAGFGGINAAGRSSGHHGYRRTVIDRQSPDRADATWRSLAGLMGIDSPIDGPTREYLAAHTLIRGLEEQHFDPGDAPWNRRMEVTLGPEQWFEVKARELPTPLPPGWQVEAQNGCNLADPGRYDRVRVRLSAPTEVLVESRRALGVSAAGQLPTGFDPKALYAARSHPRALQLALYAANDAVGSLGIPWETITERVPPDQFSLYAGSALGQMDDEGNAGLLGSRYRGGRPTSKHIAMGLAEMPADFVNAYVLGSLGKTGHNMGACATYFYNLRQGLLDIQSGTSRVAIVGGAEAPLNPDVVEGLATMGALGQDKAIAELDRALGREGPDLRRACRPFAENCGFTIAEGAQYIVLMDAQLAVELGAAIYGAVSDVQVHADGHKRSISSPGVGNYATVAKAVARARRDFGDQAIKKSFVHAHGTGTPQNRTTESHILSTVAKAFGIEAWPVAAVKCFVGHTMATAGGDQLVSALGTWTDGILPGVATIDQVADDVYQDHLRISPEPLEGDPREMPIAFLNAKGFGGNNATATLLSPYEARAQLRGALGSVAMSTWEDRHQEVAHRISDWDLAQTEGRAEFIYRYNHEVRDGSHVQLDENTLRIEGLPAIALLDQQA